MSAPLDGARLRAAASPFELELLGAVASTQDEARARVDAGLRGPRAIFADRQLAGRGQHGRTWHSPAGAALYLTAIWPSARGVGHLSGLSLAVGLAIQRTLGAFGIEARLKWPNDVLVGGRKIAGVLIEVLTDRRQPTLLVGIGLNVHLPDDAPIDQAWTDIARSAQIPVDRNELAARLLAELGRVLVAFDADGFAPLQSEWLSVDALHGAPVWLIDGTTRTAAHACGIDDEGRLLVDVGGERRAIRAGEVSVRHA